MSKLDHIDFQILEIVQSEGRISNAELAKRIHLSPAATHTRLRRLENEQLIEGYGARINREKLGFHMLCYIHMSLRTHSSEELKKFRSDLCNMPEVLECCFITGDFDYIIKVALKDQRDLERFIIERLTPIPSVSRISTNLIVSEIKSASKIPIFTDQKNLNSTALNPTTLNKGKD